MEEWWISTVGVQKWCPQPRPWQSLRPQSKLMQSTAVLNFAKSKNMGEKKKKACIPFLAGFSFACSPPGSLPFAFQWLLQQGGMENISHLHFSQTFNIAVVGGYMQKGRDWILVSAGSGRNRLQISLWKPPEYGCVPRAMVCALQLGWRVWSCSASTKTPWHSLESQSHVPVVGNLSPRVYNLQSKYCTIRLCWLLYSTPVNPVPSVCKRPTWCTVRKRYKNRVLLFAATSKSAILSVKVGKVCQGNTSHTSQRWRFMRHRVNFIKHF